MLANTTPHGKLTGHWNDRTSMLTHFKVAKTTPLSKNILNTEESHRRINTSSSLNFEFAEVPQKRESLNKRRNFFY
jgi:hypothetical protein